MGKFITMEYGILKKLIVSGSTLALFIGFFYLRSLKAEAPPFLDELFWFAYADLNIQAIQYVLPVILWTAPQVVLLYMLGDYIAKHLDQNAVYIFTRTDRRKAWLLEKGLRLFVYVLFYFAIQFFSLWIFGILNGLQMSNFTAGSKMILDVFVLVVLFNYLILLMVNILSLRINVIYSSVIIFVGNIASLFFAGFVYGSKGQVIIQMLPFTQGIYSWHSPFSSQFINFGTFFSISYLLVLCVALILWGIYRIEKMDFI